jgi:hypothetical protein
VAPPASDPDEESRCGRRAECPCAAAECEELIEHLAAGAGRASRRLVHEDALLALDLAGPRASERPSVKRRRRSSPASRGRRLHVAVLVDHTERGAGGAEPDWLAVPVMRKAWECPALT